MTARLWLTFLGLSLGLLVLVAALGDSAAEPGLGGPTPYPPWDLAAHPPAWLVSVLLAAAYLAGAACLVCGLRALASGWRPPARLVVLAAASAVLALLLVPPIGSADHLSYLAYGRIAAAGDDPYATPPIDWRAGHDPVAGAVQPPWQHTPSVYGPLATAAQALVAAAGGGSLRLTVWFWQLLCAAAFVAGAVLLHRQAGADPGRRARAGLLWTLNPLLLGQLVLGAHLDVLAVALAMAGLVLGTRRAPGRGALPAGLLLGAAVAVKLPYALFGLAAVWGLRHQPWRVLVRNVLIGAGAALLVLLPAHRSAGPHVLDQVRQASRFTSLASPWRAIANLGDAVLGHGRLTPLIAPLALLLAALLAVLLWRGRVAGLPASAPPGPDQAAAADGARAALALTVAWALTAPYALPWYDAMVWAPLALVGPSALDWLLLTQLTVLSLAYLPGRVVELTPRVQSLTLGGRTYLAPVLILLIIVAVLRWARAGPDRSGRRPLLPS